MSSIKDNRTATSQQETEQENGHKLVVKFGYDILQDGHTAVPNLFLDLYAELGLTPLEMMFIIHLMQFQWSKKNPYPARTTIASKMGIKARQISKYVQSLKNKALNCQHTKDQECDCPKYLVVTERYDQEGSGQLSNIYDFSNLFFATIALARKKGLLSSEDTPLSKSTRGGMSKSTSEEYERSKNTNMNNTKLLSKGKALKTQKGRGSTSARSQREPMTTRNGKTETSAGVHQPAKNTAPHPSPKPNGKNNHRTSNGEASKDKQGRTPAYIGKPITQDEIERNNRQGRNASGLTHIGEVIGIPQNHLLELNKQYGHIRTSTGSPPSSPANRSGKPGNWKKAPMFIQGMIAEWFSPEMHDQAVTSTITSTYKIFLAWLEEKGIIYDLENEEESRAVEETFRNLMMEARRRSKHANITKRTPDGRPNRTPFFKAVLEDLAGLRENPQTRKPPN